MSFEAWYYGLPPITRVLGTSWALSAVTWTLNVLPVTKLYLDWHAITKNFQLWRLITNFGIIGGVKFGTLMKVFLLYQHGVSLERAAFDRRPADYCFFLLFSMAGLVSISFLDHLYNLNLLSLPFNSVSLLSSIIYLWSREFATQPVSLYGMVTLPGFYMPWVYIVMEMMSQASPFPSLAGMLVGHVYYFITRVYARRVGRNVLQTPRWVHGLVESMGWGRSAPVVTRASAQGGGGGAGQAQAAAPSRAGYTAFAGRGYKLE